MLFEEKFKDHFNCNLQECDVNYENNRFEKALLLVTVKSQHHKNEVAKILHGTENKLKFQEEEKLKGPKIGPLKQRFETVNGKEYDKTWFMIC